MTAPTLRDLLDEISSEVRPVDLSDRVSRTAKRFRRRRALITGAVAVVLLGTGGAVWSQLPGTASPGSQVGGAGPLSTVPCPVFDNFAQGGVTPAEQARATDMGAALCAALGGGFKFGQVEEWVSNGGLSGGYPGRVYNVQAHHPEAGAGNPTEQGEIWLAVWKGTPAPAANGVKVTSVDRSLTAVWPDGTTINMEAGKDTPANRAILADPVFDAFAKG
jgi:hypothetical protein